MSAIQHLPFIGHRFDSELPESYKVVELKQCEECLAHFVRERSTHHAIILKNSFTTETFESLHLQYSDTKVIYRDDGERFCKECRTRMLLPPIMTEERQAYEHEMKTTVPNLSKHIIHYDDSLNVVSARPGTRRKRKDYGNWEERVMDAFLSQGPLSAKQIAEIIGLGKYSQNPSVVLGWCKYAQMMLIAVASVWPRTRLGATPKLYFPQGRVKGLLS
jgi:hypothetical protein